MDTNDTLTYFGGEVKALGGGKIGGRLVRFSSPNDPDLVGDFFTAETDFGFEGVKHTPVYLNHRRAFKSPKGQVLRVREKIGEAELTKADDGILIEAILYNRKRYKEVLAEMGWSSGTAGHLVDRDKVGKAFHIKTWPLGLDASLTWEPCEPRNDCVPLKNFDLDAEAVDITEDEFIKSFESQEDEDFNLAGIPAIARFCEAVAPNSFKEGSQRSEAAADAVKEFITIGKILGEAFFSDTSRLVRRSEHRFIKSRQPIDAATVAQVEARIAEIEQAQNALENVKSALLGIRNITRLSHTEQKAMDERARAELWNFCRITGTLPEELNNA